MVTKEQREKLREFQNKADRLNVYDALVAVVTARDWMTPLLDYIDELIARQVELTDLMAQLTAENERRLKEPRRYTITTKE